MTNKVLIVRIDYQALTRWFGKSKVISLSFCTAIYTHVTSTFLNIPQKTAKNTPLRWTFRPRTIFYKITLSPTRIYGINSYACFFLSVQNIWRYLLYGDLSFNFQKLRSRRKLCFEISVNVLVKGFVHDILSFCVWFSVFWVPMILKIALHLIRRMDWAADLFLVLVRRFKLILSNDIDA